VRVVTGDRATEIVRLAKEENSNPIAPPTHARTGFSHIFFGSVAEKVVRHAECPVPAPRWVIYQHLDAVLREEPLPLSLDFAAIPTQLRTRGNRSIRHSRRCPSTSSASYAQVTHLQ